MRREDLCCIGCCYAFLSVIVFITAGYAFIPDDIHVDYFNPQTQTNFYQLAYRENWFYNTATKNQCLRNWKNCYQYSYYGEEAFKQLDRLNIVHLYQVTSTLKYDFDIQSFYWISFAIALASFFLLSPIAFSIMFFVVWNLSEAYDLAFKSLNIINVQWKESIYFINNGPIANLCDTYNMKAIHNPINLENHINNCGNFSNIKYCCINNDFHFSDDGKKAYSAMINFLTNYKYAGTNYLISIFLVMFLIVVLGASVLSFCSCLSTRCMFRNFDESGEDGFENRLEIDNPKIDESFVKRYKFKETDDVFTCPFSQDEVKVEDKVIEIKSCNHKIIIDEG